MELEKFSKISFTGDIVCDNPLLKVAFSDGKYQFAKMFSHVSSMFQKSDYVIGALETTFSGSDKGFNSRSFAYNSPDELAEAIKTCGINVLTTANNHCFDYGLDGIIRTNTLLDTLEIKHTGTGKDNSYLLLDLNGTKVAILSYTATLNNKPNHKPFTEEEINNINLLYNPNPKLSLKKRILSIIPDNLNKQLRAIVYKYKKRKNLPTIKEFSDNDALTKNDLYYINDFIKNAKEAREKADIVLACIHSGGQFNAIPGNKTREIYSNIIDYVDGIIGNHPHVIQESLVDSNNKIIAFSLGTMNLSLSADYISFNNFPQYSMVMHFYICNHTIKKVTFSILKIVENNGYINIYPIDEFIETFPEQAHSTCDEVNKLLKRIYQNDKSFSIRKEYDLFNY